VRYLLDTSILCKRDSYAKARAWILAHHLQIALPVFAVAEIQRGIERLSPGPRRNELENFLNELISDFPVLPFDMECAAAWARYVERAGRPVPIIDSLIAGIALAYHLELVTENERDFPNLDLINPLE
jgi:predicted nucleic acid-binding protein